MAGPERDADVVIVGAGLAGLACARRLTAARLRCLLLEASDEVGGRVRTDRIGGFLLDRGFQVLPTAAPEAQAMLDYAALDLKPFASEAWVRHAGRFHRVGDPWRRPNLWPMALLSPIGTLRDKWRLKALRQRLLAPGARAGATPEIPTLEYLRAAGLSDVIIDRFMRPFFGGLLLDRDLGVSARAFEAVFRWMAIGDAALPAAGMGAIPKQIAARLGPGVVRLGARVASVGPGHAALVAPADAPGRGVDLLARAVVVATEAPEAARLLGREFERPSVGVTCLHFAAEKAPFSEPLLVLDAAGEGPIRHLAVLSNVAPSYAPAGGALIAAAVLGVGSLAGPALEPAARRQMEIWFGAPASDWRLLRIDRIAHAHPSQAPPALEPPQRSVRVAPGLYVCGDHREQASINGALASGRRAAEAVIADLGG